MRFTNLAIAAGLAATTATAFDCNGYYFSFYNRGGNSLSYQRLDPALYPGTQSPHLHSFDGANSLSSSTEYADTQSSTCTTARIKTDKSLYWRPSLFFNNGTGFYRVPEQQTKIYYKSGDSGKWANVTGFPEDFNMIAGDPMKRSDGDNPAGVRWGCHQPDGASDPIFSNGFPKGFSSCEYGFATEVTFPSCWNGEKLDPKNPTTHMAYPNANAGVGIENCPTTHRAARFPTIFIEFWYDVSPFKGQFGPNDTPWALSNGDPTGYGFHADFLNGWEKGVLEKATAETGGCDCGCGCGQTEMEQCFGSENVNKDSDPEWARCGVMGIESSDATSHVEKLPGCNPLQKGPARATPVTGAGCDATAAPIPSGSKASAAVLSYATSKASASAPAVVTSSAKTASKVTSTSKVNVAAAHPSVSIDVPNKAVDDGYSAMMPVFSYPAATPKGSPVASSASFAQLSFSEGLYVMPTSTPSSGGDEGCPGPIYVTITPTIYVTAAAAANNTSCGGQTTTRTVTQTTTVVLRATGAAQSGSY